MNDGSVPPIAPPPGVKAAGKPPYLLIGIGAVVLIGLFHMFSGRTSSVPPAGEAATSTEVPAAGAAANGTAAPASTPAAAPAGGNPILGTWTLVDTNMAAVCSAEREFVTYKEATAAHEVPAIYVVKPTYVEVSYGGPNSEEWELHGPDDITLRMTSPYSVGYSDVGAQAQSNCRYHRK